MKILITLIVVVPTLLSAMLFGMSGLIIKAPHLLIGQYANLFAIGGIVFGIISALPLVIAIGIGIYSLISKLKEKKDK